MPVVKLRRPTEYEPQPAAEDRVEIFEHSLFRLLG
jgi:hypothetical protein